MLASLSPARRRFVLLVAGLVVLVVVIAVAVAVANRTPAVRPVSQDAQPPVLLVPGYGGSTGGLDVLAAALRRAGRTASVVRLTGGGTGDLRVQAKVLDAAAKKAMRAAGASSVDVVGYSAGGVTTRLWVHDLGGGSIARRIVTLGSPQHGTDLAALAGDLAPDKCPVACQQLSTDSTLLDDLNAHDETPAGPDWVSIWTTSDKTVVPPESASLAGALDFSVQSVCAGSTVSHGDLPSDPQVIAITIAELGRSAPAKPSSCPALSS